MFDSIVYIDCFNMCYWGDPNGVMYSLRWDSSICCVSPCSGVDFVPVPYKPF